MQYGYRYELRHQDKIIATGHLTNDRSLQVGDRIEISGSIGIIRVVEPLLGEPELRLVVEMLPGIGEH